MRAVAKRSLPCPQKAMLARSLRAVRTSRDRIIPNDYEIEALRAYSFQSLSARLSPYELRGDPRVPTAKSNNVRPRPTDLKKTPRDSEYHCTYGAQDPAKILQECTLMTINDASTQSKALPGPTPRQRGAPRSVIARPVRSPCLLAGSRRSSTSCSTSGWTSRQPSWAGAPRRAKSTCAPPHPSHGSGAPEAHPNPRLTRA
jgi:hypothetical protein